MVTKLPHVVGETTITGKNQVSLPAKSMRELGWEKGDHLLVEVLDANMLLLIRRPDNWAEEFAGRLNHVFGTHEQTIQWLEEERNSWTSENTDAGEQTQ